MFNELFGGIFDGEFTVVIAVPDFILCIGISLLIGLLIAGSYTYKNYYTKSFLITLATLPAIVCVVIMMVNGNIGTGVAVAGAFSLVRFRSVPGSAKEINSIFLAMCAGLIVGMGYLGYAILFTIILCSIIFLYNKFGFGEKENREKYKVLHITIPEDLEYTDVFDAILCKYTSSYELISVKTTNMGSLFKLTYHLALNNVGGVKRSL